MRKVSSRLVNLSTQLIYKNSQVNNSHIQLVNSKGLPKLILNRPKALNSLSQDMIIDLFEKVSQINKQAFWLQGAGPKAFCAGGDVRALFEQGATVQARQQFFRLQFGLDYHLATNHRSIIANWNGIVMGGGVGLSHFAKYRIATQSTMFAMPQAKIGFFTDVGTGNTLANLRNNIGMYLGLTSGRIMGEDVFNCGLANYFVSKSDIQTIYKQLDQKLVGVQNPDKIIEQVLSKYNKGQPGKKIQNQDQINQIFSGKNVMQIYQKAKKSQTQFGKSVVSSLQGVCPLSVHTCFKLIKQSKNLKWNQIFQRDFILAQNLIVNNNFLNGVKSLLITKDNNPQWQPKTLSEVKNSQVAALFKRREGCKPLDI